MHEYWVQNDTSPQNIKFNQAICIDRTRGQQNVLTKKNWIYSVKTYTRERDTFVEM
jgi:hypothetical protein